MEVKRGGLHSSLTMSQTLVTVDPLNLGPPHLKSKGREGSQRSRSRVQFFISSKKPVTPVMPKIPKRPRKILMNMARTSMKPWAKVN